jgi:acyl dehydratase
MDVRESSTLRTTIDGIPELAGHTFGPSSWFQVTQDDVDAYAQVSRDHNPIHVDPAAAARSPFGRTVAHGYLTLSLVVPLMAEVFEVTDMGTGMNYGLDRLRFPAPVPVGARIRLRGEVLDTAPPRGRPAGHRARHLRGGGLGEAGLRGRPAAEVLRVNPCSALDRAEEAARVRTTD